MAKEPEKRRVLVIDDEEEWRLKLASIVETHTDCQPVLVRSYSAADRLVTSEDMTTFSAAIIDVRLRKQIYDQGGLTILGLLKQRNEQIPALVLTAYSYDYPGLREIAKRYPFVLAYDKEVFEKQPQPILNALLAELPPQIGDVPDRGASRSAAALLTQIDSSDPGQGVFREVAAGALVVVFVLAAALLFFMLSSRFTSFSWHLNVVFAVLVVALICVLLRIFKPQIVRQAVSIYKDLAGNADRDSREPSTGRSELNEAQPEDGQGR